MQNRIEQFNEQTLSALNDVSETTRPVPMSDSVVDSRLDNETVEELMLRLNEEEGEHLDPRWMTVSDRETVLNSLIRQVRTEKRRQTVARTLYGAGASSFIGLNIAYHYGGAHFVQPLLFPLTVCYLVSVLSWRWSARKWGRAATRMAQFDDPRAIAPLIEALDHRDKSVVVAAQSALAHLLPQVKLSEDDPLLDSQREMLYRRLARRERTSDYEFMIASLQYIERYGDYRALRCIESILESASKAVVSAEVREAAIKCRDAVAKKQELIDSRAMLLRASAGKDLQPEILLRAAVNTNIVDAKQMLRSSDSEGVPCEGLSNDIKA